MHYHSKIKVLILALAGITFAIFLLNVSVRQGDCESYIKRQSDRSGSGRVPLKPSDLDFSPTKHSMTKQNGRPKENLESTVAAFPQKWNSVVPSYFFKPCHNCYPHNYTYIINNPLLCRQHQDVFHLIMVRTVLSGISKRNAIRETWGGETVVSGRTYVLLFLFGIPKSKSEQYWLNNENDLYGDIIQENFVEDYRNLTLKTVMAWKWARTYCAQATFVTVANDEMFVDVFRLTSYLEGLMKKEDYKNYFSMCYLFRCCAKVLRRGKFIADKRYKSQRFPQFCLGTWYTVPMKIANRLYLMSLDTPAFFPDDVWIGILAEKLNIKYHEHYPYMYGYRNISKQIVSYFTDKRYLKKGAMIAIMDASFKSKEGAMDHYLWNTVKRLQKEKLTERTPK